MPRYAKRKRSYKSKGKKGSVARKYASIKKKQAYRKKTRVIRADASRALSAMPMLRQPTSVLVKFCATQCRTYKLFNDHVQTSTNFAPTESEKDTNGIFPQAGINIAMNDIFNPLREIDSVGGTGPYVNAMGFKSMSRKYARFRVVGSKTTIKFRRMGGAPPIQEDPDVSREADERAVENGAQIGFGGNPDIDNVQAAGSLYASMGNNFDPTLADPLLCIQVDRTNFQDTYGKVTQDNIDEYMDVMQYKDFAGIKWRELKAGAGTTCSFTRKWSEKGFVSKAGNHDSAQINTGTFYQTIPDSTSHPSGALSPSSIDLVNFKIRPFDKQSLEKMAHNDPRVMVTIDVDYIVKCFEPKQDYTNPFPSH